MSDRYLGGLKQGVDEEIYYTVNVSNWGSSPSNVTVVVKDNATGEDVTASVTTGSSSVSGNVITLPKILDLEAAMVYRVEVKFAVGSNILEAWFRLYGET